MASVLTCYYKPKPGGFCLRLFRCINALLERGHTVHYLAVSPFPLSHPNLYFHRFPWPPNRTSGLLFWSLLLLSSPIFLLYISIRYQITHLFAFSPFYACCLQPLRILKKIPLTLFLRADTLENYRIKGYNKLIIKAEHLLEALSLIKTRLYGVSKTITKRAEERHKYSHPIESGVIPNDIPPAVEGRNKNKKIIKPIKLACVGILEDRKNQQLIIKCMKSINATDAQLYLFGEGPNNTKLKQLVKKLNISDRVHFMGWVSNKIELWEDIDVLLTPSLSEGAPNAILEALSHNIPILASDISEHREILPTDTLINNDAISNWISYLSRLSQEPSNILSHILASQDKHTQIFRFDWDDKISTLILRENV